MLKIEGGSRDQSAYFSDYMWSDVGSIVYQCVCFIIRCMFYEMAGSKPSPRRLPPGRASSPG
jgi:hypothetical protein